MQLLVREATLSDVQGICDVYMSAFSEDVGSLQVFPRESGTGHKFWYNMLAEELGQENTHLLVVSDPAADTIIAFAKWVFLSKPVVDAQPTNCWPPDGNPELAVKFSKALMEEHRKEMGDKPHWYLETVAVQKDWMGKGVSSGLLRWGLEKADKYSIPCFLESSEVARPIYEKYGFHVTSQLEMSTPRGRLYQYFMVREEQKQR